MLLVRIRAVKSAFMLLMELKREIIHQLRADIGTVELSLLIWRDLRTRPGSELTDRVIARQIRRLEAALVDLASSKEAVSDA
jgi:hypothetical protein